MTPDHEAALRAIVVAELGGRLLAAVPLRGGYSGDAVYRVRLLAGGAARDVVVKLGQVQGAPATPEDDAKARIYAGRSWSLGPVHALLRRHGVPTYDLLASGWPTAGVPYRWVVTSLLEGLPIGEAFGAAAGEDTAALYRLAGEALGAVHAITRPYDGWADQTLPYRLGWSEAFFGALEEALEEATRRWTAAGRPALAAHAPRLRALVGDRRRHWVAPPAYVLSHADGLQAMVERDGGGWTVTGHVDLEDFAFLDARMPLAGFELSLGITRRRPLPAPFWEAYRRRAGEDAAPGWEEAWPVFRLFYLLQWSWIPFDLRQHAGPAEQAADVERFERAILALPSHA